MLFAIFTRWGNLSFVLALGLCLPLSGFAQENRYHYTLNGYVGIEGGESFNYQLLLNDSIDNYLHGIAHTYSAGGKRVTTRVVGRRYPNRQTLYIQETAIVANEGFQSKAVICLIKATLETDTATGALCGPIITQTVENGATCSKGSISLIRRSEISAVLQAVPADVRFVETKRQQLMDAAGPDTSSSAIPTAQIRSGPSVKRQATPPASGRRQSASEAHNRPAGPKSTNNLISPREITAGKSEAFLWSSDKLILQIWDDKNMDNDRISIFLNNQPILQNYTLTPEKKILVVNLSEQKQHTLTITALNNGGMPPNTAYILLLDGEMEHAVIAHNAPGKAALIRIKRQ